MHKLATHGKATVSDITLTQRAREVTEPWLPAASIPILITLLTTLLFQLSSCLASKDGNTVIVKGMGKKLKQSCSSEGNKTACEGAFCPALKSSSKRVCLNLK